MKKLYIFRMCSLVSVMSLMFALSQYRTVHLPDDGTTQNDEGVLFEPCHLPELNFFDPSISSYVKTLPPAKCPIRFPELFYHSETQLCFNKSEAENFGYSGNSCNKRCISWITGPEEIKYSDYDTLILTSGCFQPKCEVTQIVCKPTSLLQGDYDRIILTLLPLSESEQKAQVSRSKSPKLPSSSDRVSSPKQYSVIMYMLDSVSRSNFHRQFRQTQELLTELGGIEFRRQLRVGHNTLPNILALLTGVSFSDASKRLESEYYDTLPFLTHELESNGYATLYSEEWDSPSLFFRYNAKGFLNHTFSHYARPYWTAIHKTWLKLRSGDLCYGNQPTFTLQNSYIRQFIFAYPDKPKFATVTVNRPFHNDLNGGSAIDKDLAAYFQDLYQQTDKMDDSFLIVFSDHGYRYGSFPTTEVGKSEENRPYLTILPPKNFKKRHPKLHEMLIHNAAYGGITSLFDVRKTLLSIANDLQPIFEPQKLGTSLFSAIQSNRSCAEAGVPLRLCYCKQSADLTSTHHALGKEMGQYAVNYMNKVIDSGLCVPLRLRNVTNLKFRNTMELLDTSSGVFDIIFSTSPSDGLFSAAIKRSGSKNSYRFSLVGQIDRISLYGNQSYCVRDEIMKLFCFCKSFL